MSSVSAWILLRKYGWWSLSCAFLGLLNPRFRSLFQIEPMEKYMRLRGHKCILVVSPLFQGLLRLSNYLIPLWSFGTPGAKMSLARPARTDVSLGFFCTVILSSAERFAAIILGVSDSFRSNFRACTAAAELHFSAVVLFWRDGWQAPKGEINLYYRHLLTCISHSIFQPTPYWCPFFGCKTNL